MRTSYIMTLTLLVYTLTPKSKLFNSFKHRFDTYRNVYIRASSNVMQREKATMRSAGNRTEEV